VRTGEGREWLDMSTFGWSRETAEGKAFKTDMYTPTWVKPKPVVRIVSVTITEE
jgi:hypothetical protein